jgi:hypothetical protein
MNKLLLILLVLLLILVILKISVIREEGFEDSGGLSKNAIDEYTKFSKYYNWFMTTWEKAIMSAFVSALPQTPLDNPDQVTAEGAPKPSQNDMNLYIVELAKQIGDPLPPVTVLFPEKINATTLPEVIKMIPDDSKLYINALEWMNEQLEKSQKDLGSALQGGPIQRPVEKFQNKCDDISNCLMNNPEFLSKLAEAQKKSGQDQIRQYEQLMIARIAKFFSNNKLNSITQKSLVLLKKAEDIQKKAESGQLVNDINIPGGRSKAKYDTSGKKLSDMSVDERKKLQKDSAQWYAIKGLIDQINATL